MDTPTVKVAARVPADLASAFAAAARRQDRSLSAELRRLMRQHISETETTRVGARVVSKTRLVESRSMDYLTQPTETDREVFGEALAWLRSLDLETAGPDTREAVGDVADVLAQYQELEAVGTHPAALEYISGCLVRLLVVAQVTHERETGQLPDPIEPVSVEEFRRAHIEPLCKQGRRVVRVIRRHAKCAALPRRRCEGRVRARRRTAARRAAGIRSGTDPGDDHEHALAAIGGVA